LKSHERTSISRAMSFSPRAPGDPAEYQRLLDDLLRSNDELRQQAELAQQEAELARQQTELAQLQADDAKRRAEELQRILDQTAADYDRLKQSHDELAETLALLRRYIFGQRRERFLDAPGQGHLFEIPEFLDEPQPAAPTAESSKAPEQSKSARAPRRTRVDHLPHIRVEHDLPAADKICSCCGREKTQIGHDESRELDVIPPRMEVKVHVLPKYACSKCRDGVSSPPVPPKPIAGGIASSGLVSFVIVGKFADHLPLYRLEDILTRCGVYLSRSTLCDWVRNAALLLEPLAQLQKNLVLKSPVLWTDDTFVTVLGGKEGGSSKGRFWVYVGGADYPYSVYDFTMSRARDGPAAFLNGYHGFVHADAYGGYDGVFLGSDGQIKEVACWAHARRKFFDARANAPRESNQVLEWICQLYDIEDRAAGLTIVDRQALRQQESVPILDRIEGFLDTWTQRSLPKSAFGKAMTYARNQWEALRRYTSDGRLAIDNNLSERTLRLQAIGRKNWQFLGSANAGPRASTLFTILAGAKYHCLEPWAYVRDVVQRLCAGETDLESMLPDRWAAAHPEYVLEHRLEESRRKAARKKRAREQRREMATKSN
jgi:transposase